MSSDDPRLLGEVRGLVAEIFNCAPGQVTAESSSETIEGWDSLHHLNLILALEERYAISLDPLEAAELTSVAAVVAAVAEKRR